jgi:predicted nucleic acid-binding protein
LIVLDSSAWIEAFLDGANKNFYLKAMRDLQRLVVPAICLYEVGKYLERGYGPEIARTYTASMRQGQVVDLTPDLALEAATLSLKNNLSMADSIIYATAKNKGAVLWTQGADFKGLDGVKYFEKVPA